MITATNRFFVPGVIPQDTLMMQEMVINSACLKALSDESDNAVFSFFFSVPTEDAVGNSMENQGELLAHCHLSEGTTETIQAYTQALAKGLADFARQSIPGKHEGRPECQVITICVYTDTPDPNSLLLHLVKKKDDERELWYEYWSDENVLEGVVPKV